MLNRHGLDSFKKAQAAEPFSVNSKTQVQSSTSSSFKVPASQAASNSKVPTVDSPRPTATATGGGPSSWPVPEWAADPRPGIYSLEVVKDGEIVDKIALDKCRAIFGRQIAMCDFVLDHPSVSRQHAAVVHHKNGSIYVIDLGSVHGTFVANERLTKDSPVELEVGQSLRFAASTRSYVLRKNPPPPVVIKPPIPVVLPPAPDPKDEEAVLSYNTIINRLGITGSQTEATTSSQANTSLVESDDTVRATKKPRKARVTFRDEVDGILVEVVGFSDGADISTEPGPVGVREGTLVGKYESLVQVMVIPKGQESTARPDASTSGGVTQKLKQYLDRMKPQSKSGGLYDEYCGDSSIVGGPWASLPNEAANEAGSNPESGTMNGSFVDEDLFG